MAFEVESHAKALRTQGYIVIEDFLSPDVLAQVRASLSAVKASTATIVDSEIIGRGRARCMKTASWCRHGRGGRLPE